MDRVWGGSATGYRARIESFVQLVEDRLDAALDRHPEHDRIVELVAAGATVSVRPAGDGLYEAVIQASAEEWYVLIVDTWR